MSKIPLPPIPNDRTAAAAAFAFSCGSLLQALWCGWSEMDRQACYTFAKFVAVAVAVFGLWLLLEEIAFRRYGTGEGE